jgi:hypothetical protein
VLPVLDEVARQRLLEARNMTGNERRIAIAEVVARYPKHSLPWAELGDAAHDVIESYAAYRVGYHRGLDALRANGWRGSGYVRWANDGNRGFLRCLEGLMKTASLIGESDEAQRCQTFLAQLDPHTWSGLRE